MSEHHRLSSKLDPAAPIWEPVFERLEDYAGEVLRWSSFVQLFGMSKPNQTDTATIDLRFSSQPRRFRGASSAGDTITETDVLTNLNHYVILGDPGSGKTTTLKRLARAVILKNPFGTKIDLFRYPIVIRLREYTSALEPDLVIANLMGLPYECKSDENERKYYVIENERLEDVIPQFLDTANTVLMLDGLDELPFPTRILFEKWITRLSHRVASSKIVVTSRSGDYYRHLEGFHLLELCPLEPSQAREIAERWLANADAFLQSLESLPYRDLTDRPLLLSQLIMLFHREGTLPKQPSHVYRRLLRLLLEDWDKERGINRTTRYSGFDSDRKSDFLAALAYHVSYRLRRTTFRLHDLSTIYERIHRVFGLPVGEAREVAEEIASHNGLIVTSGDGFEFSHLSFQEYLCASYLVREPFPDYIEHYIADYPAPLAVAVAISSSPANWLAGLVLKNSFRAFNPESLRSFVARLRTERPLFDTSVGLGMVTMLLYYESSTDIKLREEMLFLLEDDAVLDSIRQALQYYVLPAKEQHSPGDIVLHASYEHQGRFAHQTPGRVALPEQILSNILMSKWISLPVRFGQLDILQIDEAGNLSY